MKKSRFRFFAVFLAVVLALGIAPGGVFAGVDLPSDEYEMTVAATDPEEGAPEDPEDPNGPEGSEAGGELVAFAGEPMVQGGLLRIGGLNSYVYPNFAAPNAPPAAAYTYRYISADSLGGPNAVTVKTGSKSSGEQMNVFADYYYLRDTDLGKVIYVEIEPEGGAAFNTAATGQVEGRSLVAAGGTAIGGIDFQLSISSSTMLFESNTVQYRYYSTASAALTDDPLTLMQGSLVYELQPGQSVSFLSATGNSLPLYAPKLTDMGRFLNLDITISGNTYTASVGAAVQNLDITVTGAPVQGTTLSAAIDVNYLNVEGMRYEWRSAGTSGVYSATDPVLSAGLLENNTPLTYKVTAGDAGNYIYLVLAEPYGRKYYSVNDIGPITPLAEIEGVIRISDSAGAGEALRPGITLSADLFHADGVTPFTAAELATVTINWYRSNGSGNGTSLGVGLGHQLGATDVGYKIVAMAVADGTAWQGSLTSLPTETVYGLL